jgi:hypothetical protein
VFGKKENQIRAKVTWRNFGRVFNMSQPQKIGMRDKKLFKPIMDILSNSTFMK